MVILAGLVLALAFPGAVAAQELLPAESSAAQPFPPPSGGGGDVIAVSSLPACSSFTVSTPEAFGLGWRSLDGKAGNGAFTALHWVPPAPNIPPVSDKWYEIGISMPCRGVGANTVQLMEFSNWIAGDTVSFSPRGSMSASVVCYNSTTGQNTTTVTSSSVLDVDTSPPGNDQITLPASGVSSCPFLRSVTLTLVGVGGDSQPRPMPTSVWKPSYWTSSSSGWTPATTYSQIPEYGSATGSETPITCLVDSTGADIWATLVNFIISVARLPACLVTPLGWDRAHLIDAAMANGPIGAFTSAWNAVLPASLGCGVLATIPTLGAPVVLNTCTVDFAPGWVKMGLSWAVVFLLSLGNLKRILWSFGTK